MIKTILKLFTDRKKSKNWIMIEQKTGFYGAYLVFYNQITNQKLLVSEYFGINDPLFYPNGLIDIGYNYFQAQNEGFPLFNVISIDINTSNRQNILSSFEWKSKQ